MRRWRSDGSDAPARLVEPPRFLTRAECETLAERIFRLARGGGETDVRITSWWSGELRWALNRVSLAGDRRAVDVRIIRSCQGASGQVKVNQLDDTALEAAVRAAERFMHYDDTRTPDVPDTLPEFNYLKPRIWSEATFGSDAPARGEVARRLTEPAEAQGMLSAGYIEVKATGEARLRTDGLSLYAKKTDAQCSMTVRDRTGTGSGWAGLSSYDWAQIDGEALASRALEKCIASQNPVALEPGRYTVILEPQAVGDLLQVLMRAFERPAPGGGAEGGDGPFAYEIRPGVRKVGYSKLGLKVADERVTLSHDPMDPLLGMIPFVWSGEPVRPITWIDQGVLTNLSYSRASYALPELNEDQPAHNTRSVRMSGGETSVEEMIRTTKRGLLVTRFWGIRVLDPNSLLSGGFTRDGLWLIENGKITKAVKNFRFTESPLFVLNSLEQLGTPVPVFSPGIPMVVPPLKARDFSFTATADAV